MYQRHIDMIHCFKEQCIIGILISKYIDRYIVPQSTYHIYFEEQCIIGLLIHCTLKNIVSRAIDTLYFKEQCINRP